jgi:hypothetical protein
MFQKNCWPSRRRWHSGSGGKAAPAVSVSRGVQTPRFAQPNATQ